MSETTQQLATIPQRQVVHANERGLTFGSMDDMWRFCVAMVNSGQFKDINSPEVALLRLQAGMELGLTPIWSLTNIMVTNGRPSVWGDALLGIVLANPLCEDVIETDSGNFPNDEYTAICTVRRKGREPVTRKFSVAMAKKAGIFGKNVHGAYPERMLQMRARSWACRDAFADALRGLSVREEMDNIQPAKVREVRPEATGLHFADEPPPALTDKKHEPSDNDGSPEIDPGTGLAKEDLFT
jgi:hypothetical protein